MGSLNDNLDIKIFISEFIHKHNEIINIALLLNAKFENINIIINQLLTNYQIVQINENEKIDEKIIYLIWTFPLLLVLIQQYHHHPHLKIMKFFQIFH